MAEDFWGPIFLALHENLEFLPLPLSDASDADLISWIKPNRQLSASCARFFHKNHITNRQALEKLVLQHAKNNPPLRKMIFFTWVEKNQKAMSIPSLPLTPEMQNRIINGEFGTPRKIEIMSYIDPREGAKPFYKEFLEQSAGKDAITDENFTSTSESEEPKESERQTGELQHERISQLERALSEVKENNRKLRDELREKNELVAKSLAKLESQTLEIRSLKEEKALLDQEKSSLSTRLKFLESRIQEESEQKAPDRSKENIDEKLALLENEREKLKVALENRKKTIARLEKDLAQLKAIINSESSAEQTIRNLQERLSELESDRSQGTLTAGQLVAKISHGQSRRKWLFLSVTGEALFIPNYLVADSGLVQEEWCLVQKDENDSIFSITSLEHQLRREICGIIERKDGRFFLKADDQRIPVRFSIDDSFLHQVVCGVWLEEINDRSEGIYGLRKLDSQEDNEQQILVADVRKIENFFSARIGNFDRFIDFLRQHHVPFSIADDSSVKFERDYRAVLNALRMRISIEKCCDSRECLAAAEFKPLVRACPAGDSCDFCGKGSEENSLEILPLAESRKILILGGDRVGSEYERSLEKFNVKATWFSGFRNLNELSAGLGKFDLIVVITREISHTMLRELMASKERAGVDVLYSPHRGISGLKREIRNYFAKQ